MLETTLQNYSYVLAFLGVGFVFAMVPLILAVFITPRGLGLHKRFSYESGILPEGGAWIQFEVSYYLYALIFLAFDVDVLYMFPTLLAYGSFPWRDFVELAVFVGILALAIVYAWKKGVFEW